jgi:hypothetical protein
MFIVGRADRAGAAIDQPIQVFPSEKNERGIFHFSDPAENFFEMAASRRRLRRPPGQNVAQNLVKDFEVHQLFAQLSDRILHQVKQADSKKIVWPAPSGAA